MSTRVVRLKVEKKKTTKTGLGGAGLQGAHYVRASYASSAWSDIGLGARLRKNCSKECDSCSQIKKKAQKSKGLLLVKWDTIHCVVIFSAFRCSLVNRILSIQVKGQTLHSALIVQGFRSCLGLSWHGLILIWGFLLCVCVLWQSSCGQEGITYLGWPQSVYFIW